MDIQEWLAVNDGKLESEWERLFVENVLRKVPCFDFSTLTTQFSFRDLDGEKRRGDFSICQGNTRIAIEIDGYDKRGRGTGAEFEDFQDEKRRQNALSVLGYKVLRFSNTEVKHTPDQCLKAIKAALFEEATTDPAPSMRRSNEAPKEFKQRKKKSEFDVLKPTTNFIENSKRDVFEFVAEPRSRQLSVYRSDLLSLIDLAIDEGIEVSRIENFYEFDPTSSLLQKITTGGDARAAFEYAVKHVLKDEGYLPNYVKVEKQTLFANVKVWEIWDEVSEWTAWVRKDELFEVLRAGIESGLTARDIEDVVNSEIVPRESMSTVLFGVDAWRNLEATVLDRATDYFGGNSSYHYSGAVDNMLDVAFEDVLCNQGIIDATELYPERLPENMHISRHTSDSEDRFNYSIFRADETDEDDEDFDKNDLYDYKDFEFD